VYDDPFPLLSDHPQLVKKQSPEQAHRKISAQLGLLGPYLLQWRRVSGVGCRWLPHDISKYFDDEATGLHIKEYTNAELQALFLAAGFSNCCAYAGVEGRYLRLPVSLPVAIETICSASPSR